MPGHDIIVIGASSGGIEALVAIVSALPADFPAAIFVVLHVPARGKSMLPRILGRAGPLPAAHAADKDPIRPGRIYVAPPDFHMLIESGRVRLARRPKENNTRPAADPTFRTAAAVYGPRVVGVVLSGSLDDGAAGLLAVKQRGGVAVVQDPTDAFFPEMPRNAMAAVKVDHSAAKHEIAPLLARLAAEPAEGRPDPAGEEMKKETGIEAVDMSTIREENKPGDPSVYGCPECGGVLWELQDGDLLRFRCRVGHALTADGLLSAQSEELDKALWTAFRTLQENASLARRLVERARGSGRQTLVRRFEERARAAEQQARTLQKLLLTDKLSGPMDRPAGQYEADKAK